MKDLRRVRQRKLEMEARLAACRAALDISTQKINTLMRAYHEALLDLVRVCATHCPELIYEPAALAEQYQSF